MAKLKRNSYLNTILELFLMGMGCFLAAFAIKTFLLPNSILDGGVNGVSIIVNKITKINLGLLIVLINIPFVYVGYKNLGDRFLAKSLFCMILFAVLVEVISGDIEITDDILLATVYGGVILGVGVGLIIKFGGCVDGTESVAIVISKRTSLSVGQVVLCFNLVIFLIAGLIFGLDRALYSLLTYFITYKVIDFVSEGFEQAKSAMIICENGEEMAKKIYCRLGRTCTLMEGKGLLTGNKQVLYVVVTRLEVPELKRIVALEDQSAFVTIADVSEIIGKHIKSTKEINNLGVNAKEKQRIMRR